jgi:methylmalonyl-CoA mutase
MPAPCGKAKITFDALAPMRLAAPFEKLRDRSDAILAATGARPKVFLANLGTPAEFTMRATFARSFFETGGIEAVDRPLPIGEVTTTAVAAAFKASSAQLLCLCSSDEVYADQGVATVQALQAEGVGHIYLAGRPGKLETALRSAGVRDFVFAGGDALAVLNDVWQRLEQQ